MLHEPEEEEGVIGERRTLSDTCPLLFVFKYRCALFSVHKIVAQFNSRILRNKKRYLSPLENGQVRGRQKKKNNKIATVKEKGPPPLTVVVRV